MTLSIYLRSLKKYIPARLRAVPTNAFRREKVFVFERKLGDTNFRIETKVEVDVRVVNGYNLPEVAERFSNFEIKKIDMADFAPSTDIIKERFEMGHICAVAYLHGDFVNLLWAAFDEAYAGLLEKKLQISSDLAFLYGFYTIPEYRGLGILSIALENVFNYLYKRGIRKVYTCISHDNSSSLKAVRKVGFHKIGTITYTRIYELRLYQCEGETEEGYYKLKQMFSL